MRAKIGLFCNIPAMASRSTRSIYEVPLMIPRGGHGRLAGSLPASLAPAGWTATEWRGMVERLLTPERDVRIAIVGKYVELPDAYLIVEALTHGGIAAISAEGGSGGGRERDAGERGGEAGRLRRRARAGADLEHCTRNLTLAIRN